MYIAMTIGPSLRRTLYKLAEKEMSPAKAKFLLNIWPPLFGTGIRITEISDDWSEGRLELRLNALTANMHGAAFGGALFSMTDVLFGTLVMQRLDAKKYEAWTRTGSFEFIRPGKNGAYLEVEVPDEMVEKLKAETEGGYSTVVPYTSVIRNRDGSLVGIGQQELYVRRRGRKKPPANPNQQDRVAGENLISAARTLARLGMRGVETVMCSFSRNAPHDAAFRQSRVQLHGSTVCSSMAMSLPTTTAPQGFPTSSSRLSPRTILRRPHSSCLRMSSPRANR